MTTILPSIADWPEQWSIEKDDEGIETPPDLSNAIYSAYCEEYKKTGNRPASVIVPLKFKRQFMVRVLRENRQSIRNFTIAADGNGESIFGIQVLWSIDGGMRIV